MTTREERRRQKQLARAAALEELPRLIFSLGTIIDALEEKAKTAGVKVHAETWKALHRHQQNLGHLVAEAGKEKG